MSECPPLEDALDAIKAAASTRDSAEGSLSSVLLRARSCGATFGQIAKVLGVTERGAAKMIRRAEEAAGAVGP